MTDLLIVIGLMIVCFFFGFLGGFSKGETAGRVEVASHQVSCELKTHSDKTTYWVCKETKK